MFAVLVLCTSHVFVNVGPRHYSFKHHNDRSDLYSLLRPSPAEATSEIISGEYGGQDNRLVYAVFTTPRNSISASAICAFRLRDLLDTFEGAFKEQGRTAAKCLGLF